MKRGLTKKIIIHHSASTRDFTIIEMIRGWHKEKGFLDANGKAGYHWIITGDGHAHAERKEDEWGAAVKNANHDSISICLTGNFNLEAPNDKQINTLIELLIVLVKKYKLKYWNIYGHRDIKWLFIFFTTQTACPGNILYARLPEIRKRVALATELK